MKLSGSSGEGKVNEADREVADQVGDSSSQFSFSELGLPRCEVGWTGGRLTVGFAERMESGFQLWLWAELGWLSVLTEDDRLALP